MILLRNIVFRKKHFIIVHQYGNKYMIINTKKNFNNGHTHVYNLQYAKLLVFILLDGKIKNKRHKRLLKNKQFIESLNRISDYETQVKDIICRSK